MLFVEPEEEEPEEEEPEEEEPEEELEELELEELELEEELEELEPEEGTLDTADLKEGEPGEFGLKKDRFVVFEEEAAAGRDATATAARRRSFIALLNAPELLVRTGVRKLLFDTYGDPGGATVPGAKRLTYGTFLVCDAAL